MKVAPTLIRRLFRSGWEPAEIAAQLAPMREDTARQILEALGEDMSVPAAARVRAALERVPSEEAAARAQAVGDVPIAEILRLNWWPDHLSIGALPLSTRVAHSLKRAGWHTVGDLRAAGDDDLTDLRQFGPAMMSELRRVAAAGRDVAGPPRGQPQPERITSPARRPAPARRRGPARRRAPAPAPEAPSPVDKLAARVGDSGADDGLVGWFRKRLTDG